MPIQVVRSQVVRRQVVRRCVGAVLGVLVISLPVVATAGGDVAAGQALSLACQSCHVAVTGDTPALVGQREGYIAKQLKAFKAGDRKNDLMQAMATQLSDADIANLAAYWAKQPAGSDAKLSPEAAAIQKPQMTVPKDFPKGFVLYSTVNKEAEGGVSKSYINNIGFQAVKAGKPLPDGSAIIVANYAAKLDASKKPVVEKDGSWALDKITSYAGMEARAGWGKTIPEMLRNANWNYGVFGADRSVKPVNQALCLACHKPKESTSYVFLLADIEAKSRAK
jgi:cytochrome c553